MKKVQEIVVDKRKKISLKIFNMISVHFWGAGFWQIWGVGEILAIFFTLVAIFRSF